MLKLCAAEGYIDIKYLDEAGCCLESPVSYSYSLIGSQKQLEQPLKTYGKRISILGLWQPESHFEYALAQGGFDSDSYIQVIDWIAASAAKTLAATGRLTVIIQDNGSLHTSKIVRAQWLRWSEQGLLFFFLPPYCSQLNPIESQWHQLKQHEIAGQIFDNEYDLAMCIIDGIESRGLRFNYTTDRFIFNST
jgi:putative transposase